MTPDQVVADLRAAGATVTVDGVRLRVKVSRGAMTPERRARIAEHRDALVMLLVAEADTEAQSRLDVVLGDDGAAPDGRAASIRTGEHAARWSPTGRSWWCGCGANIVAVVWNCPWCDQEAPPIHGSAYINRPALGT